MSLDLYIISPEPIKRKSTGVFCRKNGKTYECETLEQVKSEFPDCDLSSIKVFEYETNEYWHVNLTHNLTDMANQVKFGDYTLYDLMWHPEEHGFINVSYQYIELINKMVQILNNLDQSIIDKTTPSNGWGTYDQLREAVNDFANNLSYLYKFIDNYETYKIVSDT